MTPREAACELLRLLADHAWGQAVSDTRDPEVIAAWARFLTACMVVRDRADADESGVSREQ